MSNASANNISQYMQIRRGTKAVNGSWVTSLLGVDKWQDATLSDARERAVRNSQRIADMTPAEVANYYKLGHLG